MKVFCFISVFLIASPLCSQSLFEEIARSDGTDLTLAERQSYELNGYTRGVLYIGKVCGEKEGEVKSGYAEAALKLRIRGGNLGDGFTEIRVRKGLEFGEDVSEFVLREAFVNTYLGDFDLRIGHQIVVWGRADGFNPTDNITPKNMLARSPDEDDRREGNFLARSHYNLHPLRMEAIWVPFFESSVIPTNLMHFPSGVTLATPEYPDESLESGALALKVDLERASVDGSVSYFNGYNPFLGLRSSTPEVTPKGLEMSIIPKAYRMHVLGTDFSTAAGSWGFRGEIAYRRPHLDHEKYIYVPNPDLQYIIGVEKGYGEFSVIIQYMGRYVLDYEGLLEPSDPLGKPEYEVALKNRMLAGQLDEVSHLVSFRPFLSLMHEIVDIEVFGSYNITTEELFIKPAISYEIADAIVLGAGGEIYSGPDETLFGTIDEDLSSIFLEIKASY